MLKAAGLLALVVAIIVGLWYSLAGCLRLPKPTPPGPGEPTSQPASCPDVQMLSIPGTWESSGTDDPHNPTANPISLMNFVTKPLAQQFPASRVDVYTVPYVAQFSNPIAVPPDGQKSYNVSRSEGMTRAVEELAAMHEKCPLTTYVIAGFSQGAVIAGDIAAQIGANQGPVPADKVLGVTLIADGRRVEGQGVPIGPQPPGEGAEVALSGLRVPGITMTGVRDGGFGVLNDRVNTMCAPGDMICDTPRQALNLFNIPNSINALLRSARNPVHAGYNNYMLGDGETATVWTSRWAARLIEQAPHPRHS